MGFGSFDQRLPKSGPTKSGAHSLRNLQKYFLSWLMDLEYPRLIIHCKYIVVNMPRDLMLGLPGLWS